MKKVIYVMFVFLLASLALINTLPGQRARADGNIVLGVNDINKSGGEGHSLILTPSYAKTLAGISHGFRWWRSATFEWSDADEAYIVRSVNLTADGTNDKQHYIPENGFVLAVNIGNDYGNVNYINELSSDCYANLAKIAVGDKAYLSGIDIASGTVDVSAGDYYKDGFVSNAKIYIGERPSGVEIYTPDTSAPRLGEVSVAVKTKVAISEGIVINWAEAENAEYYILNVNTSTTIEDGTLIVNNLKVTETAYTIPSDKLMAGGKYTVSVAAYGEGYRSSFNSRKTVSVLSDNAANSKFKDKTVVAFGDSITYIPGWVTMLSGELGTDVINAGVGGDKTTEALARIDRDVIDKNPDIVIILFGMNDQAIYMPTGKSLVEKEQYRENFRTIIEKLHQSGAEVVLLTGNNVCTDSGYYKAGQYDLDYGTGKLSEYYDILRELAGEYNLNIIDMNKRIADEGIADRSICASGDGIHLSNEGKAKFAQWIAEYMYNEFFEGGYSDPSETSEEESSEESEESDETSETANSAASDESKDWVIGEESEEEDESNESASSAEKSEDRPATLRDKILVFVIAVGILGLLAFLCFGKPKKNKKE